MNRPTAGRLSLLIILIPVILQFVMVPLMGNGKTRQITRDHLKFYARGASLNINRILNLDSLGSGTIQAVTIRYNMIRSNLEVDWLYEGRVLTHMDLPRGLKKSVTFRYNRSLPGNFSVRFTGPAGQVQVRLVTAEVDLEEQTQTTFSQGTFDVQKTEELLHRMVKINPQTRSGDIKLARQVQKKLISMFIRQNLLSDAAIRSNIAAENRMLILVRGKRVTLSGRIKGIKKIKEVNKQVTKVLAKQENVEQVIRRYEIVGPQPVQLLPFVPKLIGKSRSEAEDLIRESGFVRRVDFHTSYQSDYSGHSGEVVAQDPEGGTQQQKGSQVRITIYRPPTVPDCIGMERGTAVKAIEESGYTAGVKYFTNYREEYRGREGRVIGQRPLPGSDNISAYSSIMITVYTPEVPALVGNTREVAEDRITKRGWVPAVKIQDTYRKEYQGQEGKVISQDPSPETRLSPGATVTITVYRAPGIPNLIGRSEEEAIALIGDTGYEPVVNFFRAFLDRYRGQEDKVVLQSPKSDYEHRYLGSTITVNIYRPSIPDVLGMYPSEAEEVLEKCGFSSQVDFYTTRSKEYYLREGRVVSQSPREGESSPQGETVSLRIYNPPLASLLGQTWDYARQQIERWGFVPEMKRHTDYNPQFRSSRNRVVSQTPNAGIVVPAGSTVTVTLYQPSLADLTIHSLEPAEPLVEGERQQIEVRVTNAGDSEPEYKIPPGDPNMVKITLFCREAGASTWNQFAPARRGAIDISPGQSKTYLFAEGSRPLRPGDYTFRIVVDEFEVLGDQDYSNNSREEMATVAPAPIVIRRFSPRRAAWGGKILLDVSTGKDLSRTDESNPLTVMFNDTEGTISTRPLGQRDQTLTVIVPDQATSGPISLSFEGVTGRSVEDLTIYGPPVITGFSPRTVTVGSTLTITGKNFVIPVGNDGTSLGYPCSRSSEEPCLVEIPADQMTVKEIRFTIPAGARNGLLTLKTVIGGREYHTTSRESLMMQPVIRSFTPNKGYAGDRVRIYGYNLSKDHQVLFNSIQAEVLSSGIEGRELQVLVPDGGVTGPIKVITPEGSVVSDQDFRAVTGPAIDSIYPTQGPGGILVTIKGKDLDLITSASMSYRNGSASQAMEIVGTPTRTSVQLRIPTGITRDETIRISVFYRNHWSNRIEFYLSGK